jgi:hypothetical protein
VTLDVLEELVYHTLRVGRESEAEEIFAARLGSAAYPTLRGTWASTSDVFAFCLSFLTAQIRRGLFGVTAEPVI